MSMTLASYKASPHWPSTKGTVHVQPRRLEIIYTELGAEASPALADEL
jgi:hypothetical protein